ncbi:hypothetical protein [Zobellia alginiliquefaciens]|uniref:hypothetical protein n=1 Tax=Zobellia alginiliquefaciens TaxID=3032586 RepID=UPI0023E45D67|nr:hypothetical protein [Zobellia alginiliquefaciens]
MKKHIVYLLCSVALIVSVSCSKDEEETTLVSGEAQISTDTGISFANSTGFSADYVTFKLRHGTGSEKEYGQSLNGYSLTELEQGPRTIYQIAVFEDGEQVSFKSYTYDSEGNKNQVKATSIVEINDNEVLQIILEPGE